MIEKLIEYLKLKLELLEEDLAFTIEAYGENLLVLKLRTEQKTLQHILDKIQELQDE